MPVLRAADRHGINIAFFHTASTFLSGYRRHARSGYALLALISPNAPRKAKNHAPDVAKKPRDSSLSTAHAVTGVGWGDMGVSSPAQPVYANMDYAFYKGVILLVAMAITAMSSFTLQPPAASCLSPRRYIVHFISPVRRRSNRGPDFHSCDAAGQRWSFSCSCPISLYNANVNMLSIAGRERTGLSPSLETRQIHLRRGTAPRRGGKPRQIAFPGIHEPRIAYAAQRHSGFFGGDEKRSAGSVGKRNLQANTSPTYTVPATTCCASSTRFWTCRALRPDATRSTKNRSACATSPKTVSR